MNSAYTHESIPSPASLAFTCTRINSKGKIPRGVGVRKPVICFLSAEFKGLLDL